MKDGNEPGALAAAGAAADAAYGEITGMPFAGRRETDVAADLAGLLRRFGHEQVDFTVVGSGPNGANPHHEAGSRVIQRGDAVVLDFGGLMDGYGSGHDPDRLRRGADRADPEVHDVVREAQQAAFEAVRPGVTPPGDRPGGLGGHHPSGVRRAVHPPDRSWCIGVTTHEPPYMVEGEEQPLVPGMLLHRAGQYSTSRGVSGADRGHRGGHGRGRQRSNTFDHGLAIVQ